MGTQELKQELKEKIIQFLNLIEVKPDDIKDDQPLFGDGLGLDSIDSIELSVPFFSRSKTTTLAPYWAKSCAVARPIPFAPPVTIAMRLSKLITYISPDNNLCDPVPAAVWTSSMIIP